MMCFQAGRSESLLAFGNGRSYGDSCHNDAGLLVPMRTHARIVSFDVHTGVLEAESGVLLSEIIEAVAKHGYFLPVTPGTRFVTLGGAIANDVHGKTIICGALSAVMWKAWSSCALMVCITFVRAQKMLNSFQQQLAVWASRD